MLKAKPNFTKAISITFSILLITVLASNIVIGGDALSGKIENGRYFVWDGLHKFDTHGRALYLEVSKWIYYFNLSATCLFLFVLPFFLLFRIKEIISNNKKKLQIKDWILLSFPSLTAWHLCPADSQKLGTVHYLSYTMPVNCPPGVFSLR